MSQTASGPSAGQEDKRKLEGESGLARPAAKNQVIVEQREQQVLGDQTNIADVQQVAQPSPQPANAALPTTVRKDEGDGSGDQRNHSYVDQRDQRVDRQINVVTQGETYIGAINQGEAIQSNQVASTEESPVVGAQPTTQIQVSDEKIQRSRGGSGQWGDAPADAKQRKPLFVNRGELIETWQGLLQPQSAEWLLVLEGTSGCGKTAALTFLQQQAAAAQVKTVFVNLAGSQASNDPLVLLDMVEHLLADGLVGEAAYQAYQKHRQWAMQALEVQRARIVNQIIIIAEGPVTIDTINQVSTSDEGKALYQARRTHCTDLTRELVALVAGVLAVDPRRRLLFLVDQFDALAASVNGIESAQWFVRQLLKALYSKAPTQVRVVLTGGNIWGQAGTWVNSGVIRLTLEPLTKGYVQEYLMARGIRANDLQQAIGALTKGHPLCMAMAADLCLLVPTMKAQQLWTMVREPFDSAEVAEQLYQALVQGMPDAAMQRLLRYGPVMRVIDDGVLRDVLTPALELADRATELWQRLRGLAVVEGTEQLRFKPVIRQRQLRHLRHSMRDELYYGLNRQALGYFDRMADQTTSAGQRQSNEIERLYHEHNMQPGQARRQWRELAEVATADLDPVQLATLLTLAQSSDFGWATPEESLLDQGNVKEYEARYYQLVGQAAEAAKSRQAAQDLFDRAQVTPQEPESTSADGESDQDLPSADPALPGEEITEPDITGPPPSVVEPPVTETAAAPVRGRSFFAGIFMAIATIFGLPVRWAVGVREERRRTASLRLLRQLLNQIQRILTQMGRIQREIEQDLLPDLQRVENQTQELINEVTERVLPGLAGADGSADLLAHEIDQAQRQQAPDGTVPLAALQAVDQGIEQGKGIMRQFNRELTALRRTQATLRQAVNKASQREQSFAESMRAYAQEQEDLGQDAQAVAEEKLANSAESGLHPDELQELDRLFNEINERSQQFGGMRAELEQALQRYQVIDETVNGALHEAGAGLAQLEQALAAFNSKLGQFDGIELTARDGGQMRTLRISVTYERG